MDNRCTMMQNMEPLTGEELERIPQLITENWKSTLSDSCYSDFPLSPINMNTTPDTFTELLEGPMGRWNESLTSGKSMNMPSATSTNGLILSGGPPMHSTLTPIPFGEEMTGFLGSLSEAEIFTRSPTPTLQEQWPLSEEPEIEPWAFGLDNNFNVCGDNDQTSFDLVCHQPNNTLKQSSTPGFDDWGLLENNHMLLDPNQALREDLGEASDALIPFQIAEIAATIPKDLSGITNHVSQSSEIDSGEEQIPINMDHRLPNSIPTKSLQSKLVMKTTRSKKWNSVMKNKTFTTSTNKIEKAGGEKSDRWYEGWKAQKAVGHQLYGDEESIQEILKGAKKWVLKDKEIAREMGKMLVNCKLAKQIGKRILGRYKRDVARKTFILYGDLEIDKMQDGWTCKDICILSDNELAAEKEKRSRNWRGEL